MVFGNIGVEIAVFSLGLAAVSRLLQIKFGNQKENNRIQSEMKKKQERLKELSKKEDAASRKEAESIQSEMMQDMNKMMSSSMKVMLLSMIIFIPALAVLGMGYNGMSIQSPIPIPIFHRASGIIPITIELGSKSNWISWYFWWSLLGSIAFSRLFKKIKLE